MNENEPINVMHVSSKEDDDPIMQYRSVETRNLKRVEVGGIEFYHATGQELIALVLERIEEIRSQKVKSGVQHILPLDPFRYARVTGSKKFLPLARQSFINLPAASGMLWMSRMVRKELPETVTTINLTMNLIRLAQAKEYTVFIVGGTDTVLEKLFFNLKRSFPRLRIVGRHSGYFGEGGEERVVEALKKTDPHMIILGLGFEKELKWLLKHRDTLGNTVLINVGGSLDIMAGKKKKAPDSLQVRGYTWLWRALNRPPRWYRLFIIFGWWLRVVYWRLFKKDDKS